jgi:hypothetical protein
MTAALDTSGRVEQPAKPIDVSVAALVCGVLGFALWGLGSLVRAGSLENVHVAEALEVVGPLLLAVAIILHVEHLSYRIGRTAVVLLIIAPIIYGVSRIPALFDADGIRWFRYEYASYATGHFLFGLGIMMVAIHKEQQMKAALEHGGTNASDEGPDVTVHASFLSLISASLGLIFIAISEYNDISGDPVHRGRFDFLLRAIGAVLITVGIISHIEHLTNRIGRPAVYAAILGSVCWLLAYVPRVYNPSWDGSASWSDVKWVAFGVAYLFGALAGALVLVHKRRLEH